MNGRLNDFFSIVPSKVERLNLNIGRLLHPARLLGLMLGVLDTDLKPVHLNQLRLSHLSNRTM